MASMAGSVARRGSRRGGLSHYWPAVYPRGHIAISNSQQPARWTLNTSVSAIQNMGVDLAAPASLCPGKTCTVWISYRSSSRCVANEGIEKRGIGSRVRQALLLFWNRNSGIRYLSLPLIRNCFLAFIVKPVDRSARVEVFDQTHVGELFGVRCRSARSDGSEPLDRIRIQFD